MNYAKGLFVIGIYFVLAMATIFTPINSYSAESFVAACTQDLDARRYDGGNGKNIIGEPMSTDHYGWSTEKWWGNDSVVWAGDKVLLLNNGKLRTTILEATDGFIKAVYVNDYNLYSVLFDILGGQLILTQQQGYMTGEQRAIKTRTAILNCEINWGQ